jgi:hypothetical protein
MQSMIVQIQLMLNALAAFLPLLPEAKRPRVAEAFDLLARALRTAEAGAELVDVLAPRLKALRQEIERMVEAGERVSPERLEAAFAHVTKASREFREALAAAQRD